MIRHHPEAELLLDFAAGSLAEPVSLVIASHACFCPDCRKQVGRIEAVGGALLQDLEPAGLADDLLEKTLARLDDATEPATDRDTELQAFDDVTRALVPPPVRPLLAGNIGDLRWRWQGPVLREARLAIADSRYRASLFRLAPGGSPPEHGHTGNEYTLVLAGSFTEEGEVYATGDFAHYDATVTHLQTANARDGCVCLTVLDAPVRLQGAIGRLLNPFLRF